jgi:hypothetical protein
MMAGASELDHWSGEAQFMLKTTEWSYGDMEEGLAEAREGRGPLRKLWQFRHKVA